MTKYTKFTCDRCGDSSETLDGVVPTREYRRLEGFRLRTERETERGSVDLCPECDKALTEMMDAERKSRRELICEWIEAGQAAQKGVTP